MYIPKILPDAKRQNNLEFLMGCNDREFIDFVATLPSDEVEYVGELLAEARIALATASRLHEDPVPSPSAVAEADSLFQRI